MTRPHGYSPITAQAVYKTFPSKAVPYAFREKSTWDLIKSDFLQTSKEIFSSLRKNTPSATPAVFSFYGDYLLHTEFCIFIHSNYLVLQDYSQNSRIKIHFIYQFSNIIHFSTNINIKSSLSGICFVFLSYFVE